MLEQKDEIALDTLVLERLGIPLELGQPVTLEWEKESSTFTLCGWWEGNLSSYASMAWVSEAFALEACGNALGYDPDSHTISDALLSDISVLGAVEAEGRLYSGQVQLYLSEQAKRNLNDYYTAERLEDFASYDPTFPRWKEGFDAAVSGQESPYTVYGADGLILEAAASENYILDGDFDAEKFATGDYCLAVGPSIMPGTVVPTYSVGEKIKIAGRRFEVMAVVSPLQPMVSGSSTIVFDLPLVCCTPVLIVSALLIPYLCFKNLEQQSIVERYFSRGGENRVR